MVSNGRFSKGTPPNYTLYGVYELLKDIDLNGMDCLDIGTMDGITAFTLKQRGAGRVVATDMAERDTFLKGRDQLGLDIEYHTPVRMDGIKSLLGSGKLDLVVNAGVLYHVFDPLENLTASRELLKPGGLLILETFYMFDEHRPVMLFNPCDNSKRGSHHANTFWRGGKTAIEGMLEVAGFKVLTSVSVNGRFTVLAQACKPSEINSSFPKIKNIHKTYMNYKNYGERIDYNAMEREDTHSGITYKGVKKDRFIFRSLYQSDMPFQPEWRPDSSVKVRSFLNDFKFWAGTRYARVRASLL